MNRFVLVKVTNNIKRFIDKCKKYNIELHNINYIKNNEILVKININDLKNVKRYNYYSHIDIYSKLGIDGIKDKIFELKYFILVFIMCLISMYFISNIIIDINVIHSNKNIRELVIDELDSKGLKKYSIKKQFDELENIKNRILDDNKDKLEWISITNVGMKYVVRVEERILDQIKTDKKYCNIISKKEGVITNIYSTKGEIVVGVNDVVKKGDVLISGNIVLNESSKGTTCASGIIMGKVWYNTSVSLDRNYYKKEYTDEERYNIEINNKVLRNNKYNSFEKKYLINTKYFKLYKEIEYKNKLYKYSEKESIEKALLEVDNKFKLKNVEVIDKKILSKIITNNRLDLNIFVVGLENIGSLVELDEGILELENNE